MSLCIEVGVSEDAAHKFWDCKFFGTFCEIAYRYGVSKKAPYPFYEIRRDHVVELLGDGKPGRVLDVGCGGAHVLEALYRQGWHGEACDFSANMVAFANERLTSVGLGAVSVALHRATDLSAYEMESYDAVLCLGPIEYLNQDEASRAYGEMRRLLKPGGLFVCAHINALFDMFALDASTADYLGDLLSRSFDFDESTASAVSGELHRRFGSDNGRSIRTRVPTRADNPLTIKQTLNNQGFVLRDLIYYRFYAAPPAVGRKVVLDETATIEHEKKLSRGWPGQLLASSFLTLSEAVGL